SLPRSPADRAVSTSRAPSFASRSATRLPMPRDALVTSTTRPRTSRRINTVLSSTRQNRSDQSAGGFYGFRARPPTARPDRSTAAGFLPVRADRSPPLPAGAGVSPRLAGGLVG